MTKSVRLSLSLVVTLAMVSGMGVLSTPAFAATLPSSDAPSTVDVNGTTWVQVFTPVQLEYIDQNQSQYLSANIELMANIDLTGYTGWIPIGANSNAAYSGIFNGQGYLISGLTINHTLDKYVGFFGETTKTIENVGIDATVIGGQDQNIKGLGTHYLGGLVGWQYSGSITDSYATGSVSGGQFSDNGGLVGKQSYGSISDSYATGAVSGAANSLDGGLVGVMGNYSDTIRGSISDSYATGSVKGGYYTYNGGLVGVKYIGSISDSYATGLVSSPYDSINGGLVGYQYKGSISNSFFDVDTTTRQYGTGGMGDSSAPGVTGESTGAMKTAATFTAAGWDFTHTWGINAGINNGYPYLLDLTANVSPPVGQMPEVPLAGVLPLLGLAGVGVLLAASRRRRVASRG